MLSTWWLLMTWCPLRGGRCWPVVDSPRSVHKMVFYFIMSPWLFCHIIKTTPKSHFHISGLFGVESLSQLTHWGRVTHICVSNLTIIGSDNGLSSGRCQAIIWTNAGILLIGPLGTNFSEILIEIQTFSYTKMHLKMSSAKWRPFCLGFNVLTPWDVENGCHFTDAIFDCLLLNENFKWISNKI